jgi:hypothetical protein
MTLLRRDSKLFCGPEEAKASAGQTRRDAGLAKKPARREATGRCRPEGSPASLNANSLYYKKLEYKAFLQNRIFVASCAYRAVIFSTLENAMPRVPKPFTTPKRNDAKTYQISLNPSSGLPERICRQWKHRSFQDFPTELAQFRNPKNKAAAQAGAFALIEFLKKAQKPDRVPTERITVGAWLEKFTKIKESPKAARLLAENTP